ncbi:uncharacterized protein LOC115455175 [Manduca sexta]|uniref:uncharacterized protein LOC115455175 n=1 Tax=Manduca sexta TaxID=7130 RepID=UPI00189067AC|nr:uncharacterized protein LOC115455175 [Manduca sexta]
MRSLNTGRDELLASVERHNPDLLALNETWIKSGEEKFALKIPGYIMKHKPRPFDMRGGGVGFYVKEDMRIRIRPHPESNLEQLWLELTLPGKGHLIVGTAYRPESVSICTAIDAPSESLNTFSHYRYIFLLTDFNVDLLQPQTTSAREIINFCTQRGLENIVHEPTRIVEGSNSLLDLIITDCPRLCKVVSVLHNPALSDHAMVLSEFNIKKPKEKPQYILRRSINSINEELFLGKLHNLPWFRILQLSNVDDKVQLFNKMILNLYDLYAPVKRIKKQTKSTPWITNMVKFMMAFRDSALNRARTSGKDTHKEYYKSLRNMVNSSVEREKSAYFNFYINNNKDKPKQMWNHLKRTCSLDNSVKNLTAPENLNDPNKINNFFLDVPGGGNVGRKHMDFFSCNKFSERVFYLKMTTESEVLKIVKSIKTKACGHDSINIEMIRLTLPVTLTIITDVINCSIISNVYPETWKLAKVKPIPKSTKVEEYKDLRPISVLPVLFKVLERVVCTQITKFLEDGNILPDIQSGFRRGLSTTTALTHVTDDIIAASDKVQLL